MTSEPQATKDGTCPWCGGRIVDALRYAALPYQCERCGNKVHIKGEVTITPRKDSSDA